MLTYHLPRELPRRRPSTDAPRGRPDVSGRSRRTVRTVVAGVAAVLAAVTLSACGSDDEGPTGPTKTGFEGRPAGPAAEPGNAPEPEEDPAGEVVGLPAGGRPWGVAADPDTGLVLVALRDPGRLAVYDTDDGSVSVSQFDGAARMIDLVEPGGPLLYPAEGTDTLFTIALPSLEVQDSAPAGRQPHQAVRVGDTTWVSDEFGHKVRVLDDDGETVDTFGEPVQPGGITAVGNRVAAVDVGTNTLFVYDTDERELVAALPAGEGPSHVVPIGGDRVAVSDVRGNAVITYDISGEPRMLDRIDVPGRAFWIEADPDSGTIYVALSDTNMVAQLDSGPDGTLEMRATVPTVRQPNSMDLDRTTGTVYVAGNANSQLQIVPESAFGNNGGDDNSGDDNSGDDNGEDGQG